MTSARRARGWQHRRVPSPIMRDPLAMVLQFLRHQRTCACQIDACGVFKSTNLDLKTTPGDL